MPPMPGRSGAAHPAGRNRRRRTRRHSRPLPTVEETSAGGLVLDSQRVNAAIIGRIDRRNQLIWSLPKGHIEKGETLEETAVREVAEETGVISKVLRPLGDIDYWFVADGTRIHKTVHHFILQWLSGELSDADIEVTAVEWVPLQQLDQRLAYPDERTLARQALTLLDANDVPTPDDPPGVGDGGSGDGAEHS